jgi:AcrR family transcriptional regulator
MSPKIVDKELKRQELVQAAVEVFATKGFRGASMEDIAVRANIGKGTIYEYFRTKEELFKACFDWFGQVTTREIIAATANHTRPLDQLRAVARASIEVIDQHIEFYPLTLEIWAMASTGPQRECLSASLKQMYTHFRALIADIIRRGQEEGDFRIDIDVNTISIMLTGLVDGIVIQSYFDKEIKVNTGTDEYIDYIISGISYSKSSVIQ